MSGTISNSESKTRLFSAGFCSGIIVAVSFNPWDRALYKSVHEHRPFLSRENFAHPYQGWGQTFVTRTLSNGIYFPLYDIFHRDFADHIHNDTWRAALAGNAAGAVSATSLNALTAVKYQAWATNNNFAHTARTMWAYGGIKPFARGIAPTLVRDVIFGGVYATLRHYSAIYVATCDEKDRRTMHTLGSVGAGLVATLASGPINYVRNRTYSTPPFEKPPKMLECLRNLAQEAAHSPTPWSLIQHRLGIGFGTLRVGVGIAVGNYLYDVIKEWS